ncbi:MAG TPA: TonB-dependent receptor [Sphingomicrobium sp.]|nr:TonB-dependent receptor [Sphingomicrobium sp.]
MPLVITAFLLATVVAVPPGDADDGPPRRRPTAIVPNKETPPRSGVERDDDDQPKVSAPGALGEARADVDADEGKPQPQTAVVVTARRLDAARTQIDAGLGATVYTLNNDTIEDRPGGESGSIADILTQSPGTSYSGDVLTLRGSKDIQIRINNVIIPEAISDPADHLSARLAQSTRVMTGTLPAQFGFVPAGVVSVTTKNGLYAHGGEAELYGATDGYFEPAVEWAGSFLNTSLFGSVSLEGDRRDVADLLGNMTHDRRRELGGLAFADHILGPNDRVSLILGGDDERHSFGQTTLPRGEQQTADGYAVGTYQHSADQITVQGSLFVGTGTDQATFANQTREHRITFGTQIDASYNAGSSHVLKAGLLASHSVSDELAADRVRFSNSRNALGLYVQDEWRLSSALTFNPGVRIDWLGRRSTAAAIEPRASLVWTLTEGLTAHAGYAVYASTAPLREDEGNAGLPDEHDDYFDAGLQYRAGVLALGADAYLRKTDDLLDAYQAIGSAVSQSFAFRRANFRGLELSATYSTHPLSAWMNVAFSRARGRYLIDNADLFSSAVIAASAMHWIALSSDRPVTGSGGVTWRSRKIALSAIFEGSSGPVRSSTLTSPNGDREKAFATVGLSAVYHVGTARIRRDFRVDLTNLTNARYSTSDASNLEGGWTRWGRGRAITFGFEQGF